jgi:hypothetical protein
MITHFPDKILIEDDTNPAREPLVLSVDSTPDEVAAANAAYQQQPPLEPQWLEFVTWLYSQPAMMVAMGAARASTSPQGEPATTALPAALEAARNEGNYPAFALTWGQFLLASGLPAQALAPIVAKAQEMHLPAEFVAALQPQPPTP